MLNVDNNEIKSLLLDGNFGLEKEALRITRDGHLSQTPHPFDPLEKNIERDFCENQTEINTSVCKSADAVVSELETHNRRILQRLAAQSPEELLWPFSNPPYISEEEDIPIAQFNDELAFKTLYRNFLSDKYGRYKMTFSGIHFNYSFSGNLLRTNYRLLSGKTIEKGKEDADYLDYVDHLYLDVAGNALAYGWMIVSLMAASPILDSSFFHIGRKDEEIAPGMSSVRCSELGYWNLFVPVLNYGTLKDYVGSIRKYVDEGYISAPSELYYPIRLKPRGENSLDSLEKRGVNHIEIRCIDLNPFSRAGIDKLDVIFMQLLLIWFAAMPRVGLSTSFQLQAVQNFKNAARFDLSSVGITLPDGSKKILNQALLSTLNSIREFFHNIFGEAQDLRVKEAFEAIDYQIKKVTNPLAYNYSFRVAEEFSGGFVKKGLERAVELFNQSKA